MPSDEEERQFLEAMHDLEEFTRLFVKKYPKLFKNGYCGMKAHSSIQHPFFPFDVFLEIKEQR